MKRISRRGFLEAAAAAGGAMALPQIVRPATLGIGAVAPSERVRMGFIGLGTQGGGHLLGGAWTHVPGGYAARDDVQVLAVCDIRRGRREERCARVNAIAAGRAGQGSYRACEAYRDFRELLARDDLDAVLIAAPIHWHAVMARMAVEAGKDVYCEKPVAATVRLGRALAEAVRRRGAVYQAGTQQRSEWSNHFRFVCRLIRAGRLGEVKEVYAYRPGGMFDWPCGIGAPQPVPDDLDWDLYLGWVPAFPYDGNPGTMRFQSGDINWTPHHFDFVQWVLDADRTGPVEVWLEQDQPAFRFPSGTVVYGRPYPGEPVGMVGGACFVGTKGRIAVDRDGLTADPASLLDDPPPAHEVRLHDGGRHADDFLASVRSRRDPICDVETAHRAMTFVLLGGMVLRLGRPLKWDPQAECFPGDEEANRLLAEPMRAPWR